MWRLLILSSLWWSEASSFLSVLELPVRGGGWVYNQRILILTAGVELKCLSPELLFQGLHCKSNFSFKGPNISRRPLQLPSSPRAATTPAATSVDLCLWTSWGVMMMSLLVITDGIFAAYLFLPSARLDSHWFCSVNNLTGYHCTFFSPPIVPVLISVSQITLRRQGGSFVFLLTETGFSWAGPKVHIRVLLRSCSEFCRYQREGCWISLKTLPSTVVFQSPRLQRSLSQAGLSLSSSNRSCLPPWILIPIPFNHLKGGLYVKFRIFKGK